MDITGFTFDGVSVSVSGDDAMAYIDQDGGSIETSKKNMTEICIQWLALHDPEVLKEDK